MIRIYEQTVAEKKIAALFTDVTRRAGASSTGSCPVELTSAFLKTCLAQSCGKCVPCRIGLDRLAGILDAILAGEAAADDLAKLETLARSVYDSADCAIGFEAAKLVLDGFAAFQDDYQSHIERGVCTTHFASVPCQGSCPAHVDIPAYIACLGAGRPDDAVRVIRRDNPFPGVCGLVCEHPCENACRRAVVDDAINIRALKRVAVETAGDVPPPAPRTPNGKSVAIVGGGPAGLTAAYFLALRGFAVTVLERRARLGGMLRYGIPAYRLPDADLDRDIDIILSLGVKVELTADIPDAAALDALRAKYNAVYLSIGAHGAKSLRIDGENAAGVLSAVELLGAVGDGKKPDFTGQRVVIVGGGNVAMDATRTAKRLGAASVTCVYRRRIVDMTALPDEIAGAQAEGCAILQLLAPVRIATENDRVTGLIVRPQLSGAIKGGRPAPVDSSEPERTLPCDVVIVAIGQDIQSRSFGLETKRGAFVADANGEVAPGLFTGGDCLTGPATVIRAIDAGKTAAANIAERLGVACDVPELAVDVPAAPPDNRLHWGRVNAKERLAAERRGDFNLMERRLTDEETRQECSRCLRCDHFGYGAFKHAAFAHQRMSR